MNLFAIAGLSVGISCVILSVLTLIFSKTKLHRQLILFNIAVSVWGTGLFFVGAADTEPEAIWGWKLAHTGGFFVGPLFYGLVCIITGIQRRKLLYFAYFQAVIFAVLGFGTKYLFYKTRFAFGLYFNEMNAYYFVGFSFYLLFVILSYYELLRFLKNTKGFRRTQTLYIIFGFMIGFAGATSSFLPMFRIDIIYPFGNFGITLYVIILTYAILRHRLMDIHLVFRKSLVYSISAGILTSVFILLVLGSTKLLSGFAGIRSSPVIVVSALIIAFLFTPLRNKVQRVIDKVFYRTTYDYYTTIQKISRELASTIDLKHIYRLIVDTIFTTLQLKSAYLLSAEGKNFEVVYFRLFKNEPADKNIMFTRKISSESPLAELLENKDEIYFREELPEKTGTEKAGTITEELKPFHGEAIAPIFIDNKLTFMAIFGDKLSEDIFSDEDIKLISTITNEAGIALKNARLYENVERQVIQLKQAEEQIRASLREKEVLSREIHHRSKNNMQIITSLLSLQSAQVSDKKDADMFKECKDRIKSMALVHEKLYRSEDFSKINFHEYIHSLINSIYKSHGVSVNNVGVKIDVGDIWLGMDTAITLGLIVNELVSNSLKHAFPEDRKGEIRITSRKTEGDSMELRVSDNGIGIPEKPDFRNTKSLGLRLVTMLAEGQLGGEINLRKNEGTEFRINFKEIERPVRT